MVIIFFADVCNKTNEISQQGIKRTYFSNDIKNIIPSRGEIIYVYNEQQKLNCCIYQQLNYMKFISNHD